MKFKLFNKIQALLLQIQGAFKEKSFSASFQGPSNFSRSIPDPCEPCLETSLLCCNDG